MATHSSILDWRIPWTEEPGVLESLGLQRVRHDWNNLGQTGWKTYVHMITCIFMFITKLFKVAKNNLNILQLMKWISKMWYIQKMDYYSATRNELLIHFNMDDPWKHCAKWKKSVTKGYCMSMIHFCEVSSCPMPWPIPELHYQN